MNNRNIRPLSPFMTFCQKVIPLAFDESLSYYECLCGLVNYLTNVVTPAVNQNADAVTELQEFVSNYFDNLNVQNEINNKLDEMAESGQLVEIISQYLNTNCIIAFNTIEDLSNGENLIDGSFVKTYGNLEYNDGIGNFYKVRVLTSSDVIDGYNIVALVNHPTLIAERIINQDIIDINNDIQNIEENMVNVRFDNETLVFGKGVE